VQVLFLETNWVPEKTSYKTKKLCKVSLQSKRGAGMPTNGAGMQFWCQGCSWPGGLSP